MYRNVTDENAVLGDQSLQLPIEYRTFGTKYLGTKKQFTSLQNRIQTSSVPILAPHHLVRTPATTVPARSPRNLFTPPRTSLQPFSSLSSMQRRAFLPKKARKRPSIAISVSLTTLERNSGKR